MIIKKENLKLFCVVALGIGCLQISGQNLKQNLDNSIKNILKTNAGSSALIGVAVADKNGNLIYEYNGNMGLTTASTQKIFSAGAALDILGTNYQYTTTAGISGNENAGTLDGNLYIFSNGDPTLGSWRYEGYKPENFKEKLTEALSKLNIKEINGDLILDDLYFDFQTTPSGWAWEDIGNYFGAGVWGINWRENQFDLHIKEDKIQKTSIEIPQLKWVTDVKIAGFSDNSIIYTAPHSDVAFINGMLPAGKTMTISGANPNPPLTLSYEIKQWLQENNIKFNGNILTASSEKIKGNQLNIPKNITTILEYKSPTMDKIIHHFLRKSVNLYGETIVKTISKDKNYKSGVEMLRNFWVSKGIKNEMINFADGSGLTPQNYVSAKAEVQALLWARKRPWFDIFYDALPTINGMKMKSGTMKYTKAFAGYHNGYTFSVILNNYQGNDRKDVLYKILNHLK